MDADGLKTFDVQALRTIGRIELSELGKLSPVEAAMQMIGRDGDPGEYRFTIPFTPPIMFTITIETKEVPT